MDFSQYKIIIVEDSSFSRALNYNYFKKLGFNAIDLPIDAAQAWEMITKNLLEGQPYDLIVTDINMPEMDGFELMQRVKSDPISEKLKILVISSEQEDIIQTAALNSGAEAFITKPVNSTHLIETLKKIFA